MEDGKLSLVFEAKGNSASLASLDKDSLSNYS